MFGLACCLEAGQFWSTLQQQSEVNCSCCYQQDTTINSAASESRGGNYIVSSSTPLSRGHVVAAVLFVTLFFCLVVTRLQTPLLVILFFCFVVTWWQLHCWLLYSPASKSRRDLRTKGFYLTILGLFNYFIKLNLLSILESVKLVFIDPFRVYHSECSQIK